MNKTMCLNKGRLIAAGLCILLFSAALFARGRDATSGAAAGLSLCGQIVIPSLFPFMIVALFISRSGLSAWIGRLIGPLVSRFFKLPAATAGPILLSFIAGYPVGARLTRGLYETGEVTLAQANTMLLFTVNAGPAFVVTAVGQGMFHSSSAGWLLLAIHIFVSLLIGVTVGHIRFRQSRPQPPRPQNMDKKTAGIMSAFVDAVSDASLSMLQICGWVVLFSVVLSLLRSSGLPAAPVTLLAGLSEVTTGAAAASSLHSLPLMSALLGWAGLSVQFQSLSSLGSLKPDVGCFFTARAVHGLLSMGITFLALPFFPDALPVSTQPAVTAGRALPLPAVMGLLLLMVVFLCFSSRGNVESSEMRLWSRPR